MSQGEMYFALHKFLLRTAGTGGADAPAGAVAVAGQVCSESLRYRAFTGSTSGTGTAPSATKDETKKRP